MRKKCMCVTVDRHKNFSMGNLEADDVLLQGGGYFSPVVQTSVEIRAG